MPELAHISEVTLQNSADDSLVWVAAVLPVDGLEVGVSAGLLVQDSTSDWNDLLLAIGGVLEKRRAPRVTGNGAVRDIDDGGGKLARKVLEEVVGQERSIQEVAR